VVLLAVAAVSATASGGTIPDAGRTAAAASVTPGASPTRSPIRWLGPQTGASPSASPTVPPTVSASGPPSGPPSPSPAASPAVPAAPSPSTSGTAPDGDAFTLVATGDLLIHGPVAKRALVDGGGRHYDFRPMLAKVRPIIADADLALCHIETPLSAHDKDISGYPVFNTPHELADAVAWAGYDGCSTASNHSVDRGLAGVRDTLGALDAQHLAHAGTARSAAEARRVELHRVKGAVVAHLSYTYGTNGMPVPSGAPWSVNLISIRAILADARRARAAGATFVVVSLHWGEEYRSAPTATQLFQAKALLASPDVDLLLGDHVHVQQPVERIGDKYVVFGMGNLLSNQSPAAALPPQTQDGAIVGVHVVRRGGRWVADAVTITATYCEIGRYTVWPVTRALAGGSTPASLRPQLTASLARTKTIYASLEGHRHDASVG
jgi:poly-gamma-glutamate capsule biosynthesis protein CapA/YwtB (metallophosphatase superfamily)